MKVNGLFRHLIAVISWFEFGFETALCYRSPFINSYVGVFRREVRHGWSAIILNQPCC